MNKADPPNVPSQAGARVPPRAAVENSPATEESRPAIGPLESTPERRLSMLGLRRLLLPRRSAPLSGDMPGRLARALYGPPSEVALPESRGSVSRFLARVPLFEGLGRVDLQRLARIVHEREYCDGEYISQEGRPAAALYILRRGLVEVTKRGRDDTDIPLATLEPPAFFDEEAAIGRDTIRWFSTRARGPVSLLALGRADLEALGADFPPGANRVLMRLAGIMSMRHQSLLEAVFISDSIEAEEHEEAKS